LKPGLYASGVAVLALVAIAITGLLARAVATGALGGALFLLGFAALFGWQIGGFIRRNKPQAYAFGALPEELLP
jgi:membrane protein CcdC involved in cytochrome C biogenesis